MQLSPCLAEAECSEFRLTRSRPPTKYGSNPTEKIQAFLLKNSIISSAEALPFRIEKLCAPKASGAQSFLFDPASGGGHGSLAYSRARAITASIS